MERYYLCPIIGRGTERDSYRAAVADVPGVQRVSAAIKSAPDGTPAMPWTLCRVIAPSLTAVEAVDGVTSMGSKTGGTAALSVAERAEMQDKLTAVGEDLKAADTNLKTLRLRLVQRHYAHVASMKEAFG